MNKCYLSLGSNQKGPERQIQQAIKALRALPSSSVIKVSSLYWSKAWGLQQQQDFCNVVVALITTLPPLKLLHACQAIEQSQGRVRKKKWGPRTLDIDILLYADRRINSKALQIPHPHMHDRDFVMTPLNSLQEIEDRFRSEPRP